MIQNVSQPVCYATNAWSITKSMIGETSMTTLVNNSEIPYEKGLVYMDKKSLSLPNSSRNKFRLWKKKLIKK